MNILRKEEQEKYIISRRDFLKGLSLPFAASALGILEGCSKESKETLKMKETEPSELFYKKAKVFEVLYAHALRDEPIFFDENWNILGIGKYPKEATTKEQKQEYLDKTREKLKKELNIKNIFIKDNLSTLTDDGTINKKEGGGILVNGKRKPFNDCTINEVSNYFSKKTVVKDINKRGRGKYLQDEFKNITQDSIINEELSTYIIGQIGNEALFSNNLVSGANAFGIMQLTKQGIIDHNKENYSIEQIKNDFTIQVKIAKRLLNSYYKKFNKYSEEIAKNYFNGDINDAKKYVISHLIINAYNTGIGNMDKVLKGFLEKYPTKTAIEKHFKRKYSKGFGYDLFYFITEFGKNNEEIKGYGRHSSEYVVKAFAMRQAMLNPEKIKKPKTI